MKQILISESHVGYKKRAHSIGTSMWHMQWCTKYRYKIMGKVENQKLMEACIRRSASRNGIKILDIAVENEHVHIIVEISLNTTASWTLQILKGGSSYMFFKKKPNFRKRYIYGVQESLQLQLDLLNLIKQELMFRIKDSIMGKVVGSPVL